MPVESSYNKNFDRFYSKALDYISLKMRTEYEVRQKLEKYSEKLEISSEASLEVIDAVIQSLKDSRFIDDYKFVKELVYSNSKKNNPAGALVLKNKLYSKGITSELFEKVINNEFTKNLKEDNAQKVFDKKIKSLQKYSQLEQKSRIIRYMRGRGYGTDVIYPLVDSYFKVT